MGFEPELGDLVTYSYELDDVDNAYGRLTGKVHAKVDVRMSSMLFGTSDVWYVVKPLAFHEQELRRDEVFRFLFSAGEPMLKDPGALEWGSLPSGSFIVLPNDFLSNTIRDGQKESYRKAGLCPRCGEPGFFRRFALVCGEHGIYL